VAKLQEPRAVYAGVLISP